MLHLAPPPTARQAREPDKPIQRECFALHRCRWRDYDTIVGTHKRHVAERQLYARQADLRARILEVIAQLSDFLLTDAGTYRLGDNNTLFFVSSDIASRYNALLSHLNTLVAEQNKLHADMATYQKDAMMQGWAGLADSP